jgi:hypothetical protein
MATNHNHAAPEFEQFRKNVQKELAHLNLSLDDVYLDKYNELLYAALTNARRNTPKMTTNKVADFFGIPREVYRTRLKRGYWIRVYRHKAF